MRAALIVAGVIAVLALGIFLLQLAGSEPDGCEQTCRHGPADAVRFQRTQARAECGCTEGEL